ncbi:MAG: glycosyltransferase family 9 protein [bacterium]
MSLPLLAGNSAPLFRPSHTPVNQRIARCPVPRDQASKRILIMRAGALGDILMATPLLESLRNANPDAHITWIVEDTQAGAIEANPHLDEIILWNSKYWKRMLRRLNYPLWIYRSLLFRKALQERNYDIFISLQPEEWSLLTRHCGATERIGIFDTFARYYGKPYSGPNAHYFTHSYNGPEREEHRTNQYLLALEALNIPPVPDKRMRLGYTAEDRAKAKAFLSAQGISDENPFVILVTQTTWPTKCWPAERFVALADRLNAQGFKVLLSGSAAEREPVSQIARKMASPPAMTTGELSFRELAAVIDRASALISGDTGPMHAASAMETPFVSLFGATAPQWYAPLSGHGISLIHPIPCGPCDRKKCVNVGADYEKCMRLITVEEVYEATLQTIARSTVKETAHE